jgi:hypothetical protein
VAEICTISLHSSYTAKNWRVMCNENNVMQRFYHPHRIMRPLENSGEAEAAFGSFRGLDRWA